jgi:LPXTG-motif cell wall-anchored protein
MASGQIMMRPELPTDNLVDPQQGYFELQLRPHTSRQVAVLLYNPNTTPQRVSVAVLTAVTKRNGVVAYVPAQQLSPAVRMATGADGLQYPQTLTLASRQIRRVIVTIPRASTNFTGERAYAIQIESEAQGRAAVTNKVRYEVGLLLHGRKLAHPRQLTLRTVGGRTPLVNPNIQLHLQNDAPLLLKNVLIKVRLQNARAVFLNYDKTHRQLKIAPHSAFTLTNRLHGSKLAVGVYQMTVQVHTDVYTKQLTRYLRVHTNGQYEFVSRSDYLLARSTIWIVSVVGLLIVIGGILIFRRRRKKHAETH